MKKAIWAVCLGLIILMAVLNPSFAKAEEEDALTYDELMAWVAPYVERAKATEPLNAPITADALSEDGYAFIYDFATLYFDKNTLDDTAKLNAIVVVSESEALPRNINVESSVAKLLGAFYNENEDLLGSDDFAYLYLSDTMPMGAMWAWVQRAGQRIAAVQYAVHEQLSTGGDGYTDCGLLYTIQSDMVVAMRAYGLSAVISEAEVLNNVIQIEQVAQDRSYFMYKKSMTGEDVEPFERDDLMFSGIDFLSVTPEECIAILGESMDDVWMDDGEHGFLRTLTYENATLTFSFDANKQNGRLLVADIRAAGLEGPRGTSVGESFSDVMQRFMHSQVPYEGGTTELLYGQMDGEQYGMAEYEDGGMATLRYVTPGTDGAPVTLQMLFEQDTLQEIIVYCW